MSSWIEELFHRQKFPEQWIYKYHWSTDWTPGWIPLSELQELLNMERRFVIYVDDAGEWRWTLIAETPGGEENIADSGEGYANFSHCFDMAKSINPKYRITDKNDDDLEDDRNKLGDRPEH